MKKFSYRTIDVNEMYVNPDNYRYVDETQDEVSAIIAMFNVNDGEPKKEMVNLAKDIIEDGLNPFEMPIVCFDDSIKKYVVYDGNRRMTCIKLMTQYNGNVDIQKEVSTVAEIYKQKYIGETSIQCVVYEEADDAIHFLNKIHNDVNSGIGKKQWDAQAKMKANAANGNKSKSYAIVEFLKSNVNTDIKLKKLMSTTRWISKLERVVSFAMFKDVYNIQFDNNSNMSYLDTEEHVLKMLSKLVLDIISNSATGMFRFKNEFQNYVDNLSDEYKTQVKKQEAETAEKSEKTGSDTENDNSERNSDNSNNSDNSDNNTGQQSGGEGTTNKDSQKQNDENKSGTGKPKAIPRKHAETKEALVLCKNYEYSSYDCLNEKGREILIELESLNVKEYPVAAVALCRCLLEYTLKLWIDGLGGTFDSSKLPSSYSGCVNLLRSKKIIDNKEHSVLTTLVNKEDFITLLNTWMHADTEACVSETPLVSGWKNARLLIEKFIELH